MSKQNYILAILLLFAGSIPFMADGRFPERPRTVCTDAPQAGVHTFTTAPEAQWTLIQFSKEFCHPPIVVVSPGENTGALRVGVVTPRIAWVQVEETNGDSAVVFWHAMTATP